jgi:hypothetical protein
VIQHTAALQPSGFKQKGGGRGKEVEGNKRGRQGSAHFGHEFGQLPVGLPAELDVLLSCPALPPALQVLQQDGRERRHQLQEVLPIQPAQ